MTQSVKIKRLVPEAKLPAYGSASAAGADLYALLDAPLTIPAGATVLVHTGIALAIPEGMVGLIYARSGLATKRGLAPANKVGVIDADYRGEIGVSLHNTGKEDFVVARGDRIAQMMFMPVYAAAFAVCDELDETERGAGGFGSTGTK